MAWSQGEWWGEERTGKRAGQVGHRRSPAEGSLSLMPWGLWGWGLSLDEGEVPLVHVSIMPGALVSHQMNASVA